MSNFTSQVKLPQKDIAPNTMYLTGSATRYFANNS